MKRGILLAVVISLCAAVFAQAQESEISGTLDVTYTSVYTWYGIDAFPGAHGEGATVTTLDLDLYGTGLGFTTKWVRANTAAVGGTSFENNEELWFTLSYNNSLFEYETYATDYKIGWTYYEYPDEPSDLKDTQEFFASLSWPEIWEFGLVPSYTTVRMWKSESGHPSSTPARTTNDISGWLHIFGLDYDLPVEDLLPELPEQMLHLILRLVWNEGAGASGVDHDWSHVVLGVSTDFDLGYNLTLTPGIYHQKVLDEFIRRINMDEDVTYATLGVKWAF